jgi:hypothetical protein
VSYIAHLSTVKNQASESLPRPDLYGAGYIRPAAIKFYIVTTFGAVSVPALLILRCSAGRQCVGVLDLRHWACQIGSDQWCPAGR